ncbi:MAG: hypothetical protein U1A78_29730 [Polyangia bacterium]
MVETPDATMTPDGGTTKLINFGVIGLLMLSLALGVPTSCSYNAQLQRFEAAKKQLPPEQAEKEHPPEPPFLMQLAILLGVAVPMAGGVGLGLLAFGQSVARRPTGTGEKDFTSYSPEIEAQFVPHERTARQTLAYANKVGYMVGGGMFGLMVLIYLVFYTPCSKFCEKPPSTCKIADAKAYTEMCENTCGQIRKQRGNEYVERMGGCSQAVGATPKECEDVNKVMIDAKLMCAEKDK